MVIIFLSLCVHLKKVETCCEEVPLGIRVMVFFLGDSSTKVFMRQCGKAKKSFSEWKENTESLRLEKEENKDDKKKLV